MTKMVKKIAVIQDLSGFGSCRNDDGFDFGYGCERIY